MSKSLIEAIKLEAEFETRLIESGGEISEELELEMAEAQLVVEGKVDSYAYYMDRLKAAEEMLKAQAAKTLAIAKGLARRAEWLKSNIKYSMGVKGDTSLRGDEYTFKLSKTVGSLEVDPDLIPAKYKTIVQTEQIDKVAIKKAIKSGEEVPGARVIPGTSLRKTINKKVLK